MSHFRTILVPVDFSSHASSALKLAARMAKDSGATVHVLHAYALPLALNSPYPVKMPESRPLVVGADQTKPLATNRSSGD